MKTDTTLKQAQDLLKLIDYQNTLREQLEAIYDSGLFSILLKANIAEIDKEKFREVCGLKPSLEETFSQMIAAGTMIVHRGIKVNRNRTPQEAIAATGRKQHIGNGVVSGMPRNEGEVVDLYYFKENRSISDDNLEKRYEELGLAPDPYAQAADNEANPAFANDHPNSTHWKNSQGEWCFSVFNHWCDECRVSVNRSAFDWPDRWWFGGRKLVL
jgi:hypothetical protein